MGRRRRSSKRSDRRTSAQSATKLAREHYPLALRAGVNKSPLAPTIGWRGDYSSTLTQIEPALQMAPLDLKWLREFLGKHPRAIRHQKIGEGDDTQIVLTASTPEVRKFVEKHLKTKGAFGEPINLKRKQSETKSQK